MKRNKKNLQAVLTIAIAVVFILPTAVALESGEQRIELDVDLGGPYYLDIGELHWFYPNITGGVPPYGSKSWDWGDGSGGSANGHAWGGNEPSVFNVAVRVKDSVGNIGVGTTRVYTELPTDNNVFISKFVKKDDGVFWKKQVVAEVGDLLHMKIRVQTIGSDRMNLSVYDEHTPEFACTGNYTSSIPADDYLFYPGGGTWGPAFGWLFNHVEPGTTIEIYYDTQVIKEFCGWSYYEGLAGNGAGVTAYLDESGLLEPRMGPSDFLATDNDGITVQILREPGETLYVDDDGSADYTSIQDAVDAASDGDTVYVYAGIYIEHVEVNKAITLQGQGQLRTIIDGDVNLTGSSIAVQITADGVTIRGFTIRNAMKSGIYVDSVNNTITRNNIINNGQEGIYLTTGDDNNIITKNKIIGNWIGIIVGSGYNLIKGNTIKQNIAGIIVDPECWANMICQNSFIQNSEFNALDWNFNGNHWTGFDLDSWQWMGNYWDDYTGEDADEDNIGDTPYYYFDLAYSPGLVLDLYPLMEPLGSHVPPFIESVEVNEI